MKVLVVLTAGKLSGAEKRITRLVIHAPASPEADIYLLMSHELHEAAVAHPEFEAPLKALKQKGRLLRAPSKLGRLRRLRGLRGLPYLSFLCKLIKQLEIDLVHSVLDHATNIVGASMCRVPILCEMCGPNTVPDLFGDPDELAKDGHSERDPSAWLKRQLVQRVAHFWCVSPSVEARMRSQLALHGMHGLLEHVSTPPIPLYIKRDAAKGQPRPKENLLVYASAFYGRKHPHLAAEVFRDFLLKYPNWKGAFLGGGRYQAEVEALLKPVVDSGQIEVIGRVADIYPYLMRSKIYVSLIKPDNYPSQSIFEAMACCNALVCSDVGDTARMVKPDNGKLVPFDREAIVAALQDLVMDEARLQARGEASLRILDESFPSERYYRSLFMTYKSVQLGVPATAS
jgi:glycosyltransferase involved in cell wall biosynthesis